MGSLKLVIRFEFDVMVLRNMFQHFRKTNNFVPTPFFFIPTAFAVHRVDLQI